MSLAAGSVATYLWTAWIKLSIVRVDPGLVDDVSGDTPPQEQDERMRSPEAESGGDVPASEDINIVSGDVRDAVSPEDLEILEEIAEQVDADDG
jgi:hypothetical protein